MKKKYRRPYETFRGISFSRVQFSVRFNNILSNVIAYLRCDKTGTILQFHKRLSYKLGCPIVRIDFQVSPKNPTPLSYEINFLRDSLTEEEKKIFNIWKKNIKKYPVHK